MIAELHRVTADAPPAPPMLRVATAQIRLEALAYGRLVDSSPESTPRIERASRCTSRLLQWWPGDGVVEFRTQCRESKSYANGAQVPTSGGPWSQLVQIPAWTKLLETDKELLEEATDPEAGTPITWEEAHERLRQPLQSADVLVWCDCPDFTYSGANYNVTQQQSSYPGLELFDAPDVQKSRGRGTALVCKHLISVYFGFFT